MKKSRAEFLGNDRQISDSLAIDGLGLFLVILRIVNSGIPRAI